MNLINVRYWIRGRMELVGRAVADPRRVINDTEAELHSQHPNVLSMALNGVSDEIPHNPDGTMDLFVIPVCTAVARNVLDLSLAKADGYITLVDGVPACSAPIETTCQTCVWMNEANTLDVASKREYHKAPR